MRRKSRVTAISLPKEIDSLLDRWQKRLHKNRSELLREMINFYTDSNKKSQSATRGEKQKSDWGHIDNTDANKILKLYYKLLSETKPKPTMVIGVGVVSKGHKVVIGLRKTKDQTIKDLHWTFPSGKFESLNFEKEVIKTVIRETGLDIKITKLVHARLIPDSPEKKIRVVALYYHCRPIKGSLRPGGDFKEARWVPAVEVNRHFTTSVADEVMNFLGTL